ncbi:hypothetical protein RND81_13G157700 [Saponaria officinalis]|uniref:Uncharacterized protein n=1 Tax=Saponaria officinalis TaxID=3572 RepID=A0AAW1H3V5_SAPOF
MAKSGKKISPTMKKSKGKQLVLHSEDPDCIKKTMKVAFRKPKVNSEKPSGSFAIDDNDPNNPVGLKCRPLNLVELMSGLTSDQRAAVQDIGFGGLLHLKVRRVPKNIVDMLLSAFNDGSFMFHTPSFNFLLRKEDVHDCFLLPMGPKEVPILGMGRSKSSSQESCIELKEKWRNKFGVEGSSNAILIGKLYQKLLETKECGDDFKRLFVLYSMSAFLAPTTNSTVDLKLVLAVDDVSEIGQLDWCAYVFNNLVKACVDSKKKPAFIGGCIVFLMIAYFHRFDFQGEAAPTSLPLIQHWDYESLKRRAAAELKSGFLGNAVLSSTRYPICMQPESSAGIISDVNHEDSIKLISSLNRKRKSDKNTNEKTEKRKCTRHDTPSTVLDHNDIQDSPADDLHELIMALKTETEVFLVRYNYLVEEIKKKISAYAPTESAHPAEPLLSPTQAFFADPELHRYVDEVVKCWEEIGVSGYKVFKFDIKRVEGQPKLTTTQVNFIRGQIRNSIADVRKGLVCNDISEGQEKIPIPATNVVDDPRVPPTGFKYNRSIQVSPNVTIPPPRFSCRCKGSCDDPNICACARLNGSESSNFPYVHKDGGRLIEAKAVVFECGPQCSCGPDCANRTSQQGIRFRLEVFRTPKKGWGVRSWDYIPAGSPICECTGVLKKSDDADHDLENYFIFDIDCLQTMKGLDGRQRRLREVSIPSEASSSEEEVVPSSAEFCIDASETGNVMRFINHSCDPNLFVQCVLSSHHALKLARIMLFAADNIPPLQELSYDYGYALDSVIGPDGKPKQMACYCGAAGCRKRLF